MKKNIIAFISLLALTVAVWTGVAYAGQNQAYAEEVQDYGFQVSCHSAYLTDFATGAELYAMNADSKHEIASMVKIMTATLVFEAIDEGKLNYDDKIT